MCASATELRRQVDVHGYAVVTKIHDAAECLRWVEGLGQAIHRTEVCLSHGKRTYLASPEAIPLHTDHPDATHIAWHCHEQDHSDGATTLLDLRRLLVRLPPDVQADLARIRLACPVRGGLAPAGFHPLWDCHRRHVFYAPWLISHECHPGQEGALVADLIAQSLSKTVRVRLAPGQSLFIDNQRMLHGRDALETTSMRRLTRWWVKAHPIDTLG